MSKQKAHKTQKHWKHSGEHRTRKRHILSNYKRDIFISIFIIEKENLVTYYMFGDNFREILGYLMNIYILVIVAFVGWNFVKDTQQVIYWKRHNMERGEYFDNSTQY